MPVIYRYLKYEFDTEENLQIQLDNSLAEGVHNVGKLGTITVVDSDFKMDKVIYETIKPTGVDGCITRSQLRFRNTPTTYGKLHMKEIFNK